jgi:predicted dehydrogenase
VEQKIDLVDPGFVFPREDHSPQSLYDAQMKYFLECIETRQNPNPGGLEGLMNMKVIDAAYESSRTGKVMEIR